MGLESQAGIPSIQPEGNGDDLLNRGLFRAKNPNGRENNKAGCPAAVEAVRDSRRGPVPTVTVRSVGTGTVHSHATPQPCYYSDSEAFFPFLFLYIPFPS